MERDVECSSLLVQTQHTGEWRQVANVLNPTRWPGAHRISKLCGDGGAEGKGCAHGLITGVIDHWSCCGSTVRNSPTCAPVLRHCEHCRGIAGACVCASSCARPAAALCFAFSRLDHAGEWRDPAVQVRLPGGAAITKYCGPSDGSEGAACTHARAKTVAHWSCCGVEALESRCAPFVFVQGAHTGEWRMLSGPYHVRWPSREKITHCCSLRSGDRSSEEGVQCSHRAILKEDHWSCCGGTDAAAAECVKSTRHCKHCRGFAATCGCLIGCDRPIEALCTPHEDLSPSAIQLLLTTLLAEQPELVLRIVADPEAAGEASAESGGVVEDLGADSNAEVVIARL